MDVNPPLPLSIAARQTWNREVDRIHSEGRLRNVDLNLLAVYAQTLDTYQRCRTEVDRDGVLVAGTRKANERIRHPLLTPMSQCRDALVKLSRAIPLADPTIDKSASDVDHLLEMLTSE